MLQDFNGDSKVTVDDVAVGFYDLRGGLVARWQPGLPLPSGGIDAIRFDMSLGGSIATAGIDIPLNLNIPGLTLDVKGGFSLGADWQYDFGFGLSVANGFFLKTNSTNEAELRLNLRAYLDGDPKDASVIYIAGDFNQAQANPTIAAFRVRYLGNGQWSTASLTDAMNASHGVSASCLTPRMPARASSSCSSGPKKAILRRSASSRHSSTSAVVASSWSASDWRRVAVSVRSRSSPVVKIPCASRRARCTGSMRVKRVIAGIIPPLLT